MNGTKNDQKRKGPSTSRIFADAVRDLLPYTNLPYQLIAAILLFFGIGYGLDAWLQLYPTLTVVFSIIGVTIGLYSFIKSALHLSDRKSTTTRKSAKNPTDDTD